MDIEYIDEDPTLIAHECTPTPVPRSNGSVPKPKPTAPVPDRELVAKYIENIIKQAQELAS